MAQTSIISTQEVARQGAILFDAKSVEVMLCTVLTTGFTVDSLVSDWETVELSGNGYERYITTTGTGAYNTELGAYYSPWIEAAFTASGGSLVYDRVVIFFTGETRPHSIIQETPGVSVPPNQTQSYRLRFRHSIYSGGD